MKPITFATLFPHLRGWVQNLIHVWPAYIVKPNFAIYEVFHIFAIILLGGTTVLIGLRLIGKGLTEEPASVIYRNLRPWLHLGVVGIVVSGVLIGMANAERLYDSPAFLVKMLALAAGVVFTYGVTRPVALADGHVSPASRAWAFAAALIFALGFYVFLTGGLITPGLFHVLTAAGLIVLVAVKGVPRWIYAAGVGVLLLAMYLATHVIIPADDLKHADPANVALSWALTAWIAGFAVWQASRGLQRSGDLQRPVDGALAKAVGYGSILVWVTAAAAGRWIAFA